MKRQALLVAVCVLLGFSGFGCGAPVDDPAPQTGEQTSGGQPDTGTPTEGNESSDGEVEALARNCKTTCTGKKATGEACGVVGFGSTTFLGGCTKACRFARSDADSKASAYGCELTTCSDSCQ